MRAFLNLRYAVKERRTAFTRGLSRLGYKVVGEIPANFDCGDIFVTWNRIGAADSVARRFADRGCRVLVTENASWGNDFLGERWYSMFREHHNTAGNAPYGGPERWDSLGVVLPDVRTVGETVILPQRGIGSSPVAMPKNWPRRALKRYGGRIRPHPGKGGGIPLQKDLASCGRVVTWGSGAAIKAALMGIPVISEMPDWVGEHVPGDRVDMLRRLAWGQWRLSEIASGEAFEHLL